MLSPATLPTQMLSQAAAGVPNAASLQTTAPVSGGAEELEKQFTRFVGQTFFSQLISAMRETVDPPAYFHGGRGEEVFQSQYDQYLVEHMTEATADEFAKPMFDLFMLQRNG